MSTDQDIWGRSIAIRSDSEPREEAQTDSDELQNRIFDLENQLAETTLELSRASIRAAEAEANLEPAKERIRREALREAKKSKADLLRSLLEVVDNFDRALESHADDDGTLAEGVRLVHKHFLSTLAGYGVAPMEAQGAAFTPATHDAISTMSVDDPALDGTVVAVVQKGYTIGDDVLRPAKVVVGKLQHTS